MKVRLCVLLVLSELVLGCGPDRIDDRELELSDSSRMIENLKTDLSAKNIRMSAKVSETVLCITNEVLRRKVFENWVDGLLSIDVAKKFPRERYSMVKEASDVLGTEVMFAATKIGYDIDSRWTIRFRVISWLDHLVQNERRYLSESSEDDRRTREAWGFYQGLSELREMVVEDFELNGSWPSSDSTAAMKLAKKFEEVVGRPFRFRKSVTRLGAYVKQARARVEAERKAALKGPK